MKTLLPTASRKRLEELLEYLGDRADDFKKCFDIESEWCWKYADIVLRGFEKRELGYSEGHHVVPASFYGKRCCSTADDGNLTVLSYVEHVWVHYCACYCATGKMRDKMARAFLTMYNFGISGSKPLMPSEEELLAAIPELEIRRIQAMEPQWAKVEAEGRTHYSDDPKQFKKDRYEANKDKILKQQKARYEANKAEILEKEKARRQANKEKIAEKDKARYEANKEKILKRNKARYEANKAEILEKEKARRQAKRAAGYRYRKNPLTGKREWVFVSLPETPKSAKANKEKIAKQDKARYEAKKAAGYRFRTNPVTGKREWVFVGLPESPKSTEVA